MTTARLLDRTLPAHVDNAFPGHRAALWLLGVYIAVKLAMSVNSIAFTARVASVADGFRLDAYGAAGAQAVLMLFALVGLGQLALAMFALVVLLRYRALVPFAFLLLTAEHIARRLVIQAYAVERTSTTPAGTYVNMALLAVLLSGLALSLWSSTNGVRTGPAGA